MRDQLTLQSEDQSNQTHLKPNMLVLFLHGLEDGFILFSKTFTSCRVSGESEDQDCVDYVASIQLSLGRLMLNTDVSKIY